MCVDNLERLCSVKVYVSHQGKGNSYGDESKTHAGIDFVDTEAGVEVFERRDRGPNLYCA